MPSADRHLACFAKLAWFPTSFLRIYVDLSIQGGNVDDGQAAVLSRV